MSANTEWAGKLIDTTSTLITENPAKFRCHLIKETALPLTLNRSLLQRKHWRGVWTGKIRDELLTGKPKTFCQLKGKWLTLQFVKKEQERTINPWIQFDLICRIRQGRMQVLFSPTKEINENPNFNCSLEAKLLLGLTINCRYRCL